MQTMPRTEDRGPIDRKAEELTDVKVYKFGIIGDLPQAAMDEMYRAHELRNCLVEVEMRHAERVAAVWAENSTLAEMGTAVQDCWVRVEAAIEDGKKERQQTRSTKVSEGTRDKIKAARGDLADARKSLREAKARLYPVIKPALAESANERRKEIKALYARFVEAGLYWATINDVVAHHETAVKAVAAKRKNGQPAQMRFSRWSAEGTLTAQLQRGANDPPRTPALLANPKGRYYNVAALTPALDPTAFTALTRAEQRRAGAGRLRMRIGSGEYASWLDLPVRVHRSIPVDGDITLIRLTRRTVAGQAHVSVSVTVKLQETPKQTSGPLVGVHVGWRSLKDGGLRIAAIAGAPTDTRNVQDVIRQHDGWAELVLPARWRQLQSRFEATAGQRDRNMDVIRASLLEWAKTHPDREDLEHLARWRSPRRFVALALRWREEPPEDSEAIVAELEAWRRQDKHLWAWEANERDTLLGQRKDAWRRVAAWLATDAAVIVIDSWKIDARRPPTESEDTEQERAARANRVLASPADLRNLIKIAANNRGVEVHEEIPHSTHHLACGSTFDAGQQRDQIMVWCSTCHLMVDQDVNAVEQLMRAVQSPT